MLASTRLEGRTVCRPGRLRRESLRFELVGPDHPQRSGLQAFIAAEFERAHGAHLQHFCSLLVGSRDLDGRWRAAVGVTRAQEGPLFLEQYLDVTIEEAIAMQAGETIDRADIVEVGNLAAGSPGAARDIILFMTAYLSELGMRWVAFTATQALLNSFLRLRLRPAVLAVADPARLPDKGRNWGSYYEGAPRVLCGDIESGYASLLHR